VPDLRGKVALVTGVGRVGQIGYAVATGVARAGAQLVIADRNTTAVAERARELASQGFAVQAVGGDLTTPEAARRAVATARERFGGLDVVVNVAGGLVNYGPAVELGPEQVERELAVNIKTTFFVSQAAIPLLRERGGGAIVNFASMAVLKPQSQMAVYIAAKAAVAGPDPRERGGARDDAHRRQPRADEGRESALGGARRPGGRGAVPRKRRGAGGERRDPPGGRRRRLSDPVVMRDVIVVGGGCYGSFYAAQLAKAKARGRARFRRVVVVDREPECRARRELGDAPDRTFVARDWSSFFREFLGAAAPAPAGEPEDYIVPSPLMPHLMFEWVLERARARWPGRAVDVAPVPDSLGTPYDRTAAAPDHTRYVSFADWICPTHCIEPAICPAIDATRSWEMGDAVRPLAARLQAAGEPVHAPATPKPRPPCWWGRSARAMGR